MTLGEDNAARFTPFWPMCLLALSLAVFLGWQGTVAAQQYVAALRLADQQTLLAGQAAQAEGRLQAMMMDLLELSKTDPDARGIVNKYGITFNPAPSMPPAAAAFSSPMPANAPRDTATKSGTWTDENASRGHQE